MFTSLAFLWRKIARASYNSVVPSEFLPFAGSKRESLFRSNKIASSDFKLDTCTATFCHIPTYPCYMILKHRQSRRKTNDDMFFLAFAKASAGKDAAFWWEYKRMQTILFSNRFSNAAKAVPKHNQLHCTPPERLTLAPHGSSYRPFVGRPFLWKGMPMTDLYEIAQDLNCWNCLKYSLIILASKSSTSTMQLQRLQRTSSRHKCSQCKGHTLSEDCSGRKPPHTSKTPRNTEVNIFRETTDLEQMNRTNFEASGSTTIAFWIPLRDKISLVSTAKMQFGQRRGVTPC